MKYAKKMKLIEVDDINIEPHGNSNHIDDENYSKPRVLSPLDNVMNEILHTSFISDAEKWRVYSQALQRYLNHVKITSKKINYSTPYPDTNNKNISIPALDDTEKFNFTIPDVDMSGLYPIRDSLDSISQPIVRNFFQAARNVGTNYRQSASEGESIGSQSTNRKINQKKKSYKRISNQRETRSKTVAAKRRAENNLSSEISHIRPCKVVLSNIRWKPTSAR